MALGNPVTHPRLAEVEPIRRTSISPWCLSWGKRMFDLGLALLMLVPLLPLMLVIALAVKLSSKGPVLFRQLRCGIGGTCFQVLKFRTMSVSVAGPSLTQAGDPRVTRVGRVLRKWKLDELPQLFNVLRGEMSLIGPRPDLPEYFDRASRSTREVLALRPGITGWASVHFRNEEELLAQATPCQLGDFYLAQVLPQKAALDLEYAGRATLLSDTGLLFHTLFAVLPSGSRKGVR